MLLSVVIPVYNGARYLERCLRSVGKQKFSDFELIVVDDGSTDASGVIADEYASTRENVRVIHGANEGPLLARRRGLINARGEYVVFLDADDALRNDALTIIASVIMDEHPDVVSFRYSREERLSNASDAPVLPVGVYTDGKIANVRRAVLSGRYNSLWGKAIRRSCIDIEADYSGFARLMMGEDLFQLLPIVDASSSLVHLNEILYFYRPNEASTTAAYRHSYLADIERVAARMVEYGNKWKLPADGRTGALQLYVNLSHMLADSVSELGQEEAQSELEKLCASLASHLPNVEDEMANMRLDNRKCLRAVLKVDMASLRRWTKAFHAGRRLLRRGD